jgi:hypothetical protein
MFGDWLNGVPKNGKAKVRIGISTVCWSIWRTRNDFVFNNQKNTNILQVIYQAVHWIRLWALLLPKDKRKDMITGCNRLLVVTQDFFFRATGW